MQTQLYCRLTHIHPTTFAFITAYCLTHSLYLPTNRSITRYENLHVLSLWPTCTGVCPLAMACSAMGPPYCSPRPLDLHILEGGQWCFWIRCVMHEHLLIYKMLQPTTWHFLALLGLSATTQNVHSHRQKAHSSVAVWTTS